MVGLLQTPPSFQKSPYEIGIQPDPEPRKKRKITHSASFVKAKKRYLYNENHIQVLPKTTTRSTRNTAKVHGRGPVSSIVADTEMEEAAEALLSVSPLLQPKVVENDNLVKSPLSLLCNVLCSLGPASQDTSTKLSKGSLVQSSLQHNEIQSFRTPAAASVVLGKEFAPSVNSVVDTQVPDISVKEKRIGIYTSKARRQRIQQFLVKRAKRVWVKKVRYSCRKNLADGRVRVKGRFVSTKNPA